MKLPCKSLVVAAIALALSSVSAKNSTDLTLLGGDYTGKVKISGKSIDGKLTGDATIQFKVSGTGLSGDIKIKSAVTVNENSVDIAEAYKLLKSGRVKIDEVAPGVTTDLAVKTTYRAGAKAIRIKGKFDNGSAPDGNVKITIRFKPGIRQKIEITQTVGLPGSPNLYIYQFSGFRKAG